MLIYLSLIGSEEDRYKFVRLYHAYKDLMLYLAGQILDERADAEDAVHEACLRILEIIDKIHDPVRPKTRALVGNITKGKVVDLYRKRKRLGETSLEELDLPGEWPSPSQAAELSDPVDRALAGLPRRQRDLLLLKYDQGFSTGDIARMMDMSPANVEKTLQRAKAQLRKNLEKEGIEV